MSNDKQERIVGASLLVSYETSEAFKEAPYMMPIMLFAGLAGSILLWSDKK